MPLLGVDAGVFLAKACAFYSENQRVIAHVQCPDVKALAVALQNGRAGRPLNRWRKQMQQSLKVRRQNGGYNPKKISAIGIARLVCEPVLWIKSKKICAITLFGASPERAM